MEKKSNIVFGLFVLVVIIESINCTVSSCYNAVTVSAGAKDSCSGANVNFCTVTFDGSGTVTGRGCAETCNPTNTLACCTANDCNDATDTTLRCIQCFDEESCATSTTTTRPCASANAEFCTTTFEGGAAVSKVCSATEVNSDTQVSVVVGSNANTATKLRTCLQCEDEATCNTTTQGTVCATASFNCYTDYDSDTGLVTGKGCTEDLTSTSHTYELCTEDDCNVYNNLQSCYVCNGETDCASTDTPIVCSSFIYYGCKTEFDEEGDAIKKICSNGDDCTPSDTTACCQRSGCNSANTLNLTCYQCNDISSCSVELEPTACPRATDNSCMTLLVDGVAVMKSCAASSECTDGLTDGVTKQCCYDDACNSANKYSISLLIALFMPLLASINKYIN